jgi:hypothetical protein
MSPQPAMISSENQDRILKRYNEAIQYYWTAGKSNRKSFKLTRYLTVLLGALVTLVASLSSSQYLNKTWAAVFAILTPVLAALTAIVAGISQSFQWGAAWSDMAITATRLEGERDRVQAMKPDDIDAVKEMGILNDLVLGETQGFFQRIFGTGGPPKEAANVPGR